jgi:hypothetical protein
MSSELPATDIITALRASNEREEVAQSKGDAKCFRFQHRRSGAVKTTAGWIECLCARVEKLYGEVEIYLYCSEPFLRWPSLSLA